MRRWLLVVAILVSLGGVRAAGQPQTQPLIQSSHLRYLGSFAMPAYDGAETLTWGGYGLGVSEDGTTLAVGCHDHRDRLALVRIPAIDGTATMTTRCQSLANLNTIDPNEGNGYSLGGSLSWGGRWIVSAFSYYDANGSATLSHWRTNGTLGEQIGPVRFTARAGVVAGYMTAIPPEWRGLLGGPALTGLCCTSIIGRSSYGPAAGVFEPDDVGTTSPVPVSMLVEYPDAARGLGAKPGIDPYGQTSTLFNGSTMIRGIAFPRGTRSVLFVGVQGTGRYCYGSGIACGDPTSAYPGTHAYPYQHQIWAYDANDLLAVKRGERQRWEVQPYGVWRLEGINSSGSATITGATFDPVARRLYVAEYWKENPRVHVYELQAGTPGPTPTPTPTPTPSPTPTPIPAETFSTTLAVPVVARTVTVSVPVTIGGTSASIPVDVEVPAGTTSATVTCTRPAGGAWRCEVS